MKRFRQSSSSVAGMALCLGLTLSCAYEAPTTPNRVYSSASKNDEDIKETDDAEQTDKTDDQTDDSPVPPSNDDKGTDSEPVKPASVSVSLSPSTLSTSGEGFFVRGLRLQNDSILVAYCQNINNQYSVKTEISIDDGKTWLAFGQIISVPFRTDGAGIEFEPTIAVLPSGTLVAAYVNYTNDGIKRLQLSKSLDNGKTWTYQGDADTVPDTSRILHPNLFINSKGQIQLYYSKARASDGFEEITLRTSSNEGLSWSGSTIVATRSGGNSAFSGATRLNDGSILVVFDTARGDGQSNQIIRSVQSNNEGLTWSTPKDVYIPLNGEKKALSPQVILLDDGRPVVMFMSDEEQAVLAIKLMIAASIPSFSKLEWMPQAVTAIPDGFQPGAIPAKDASFILAFERGRKIFFHRVSIKGGI